MTEEWDEGLLYMEPREVYDACVLGIAQRFNSGFIVYDRACVIEKLMADMDEEDAEEFFSFNIVGGWVGDATPAYLERAPVSATEDR